MFGDGSLTFREFASREPLPLARIHDGVLEFLRGRENCALIGAHAVNAYADEARMTPDVDIVSVDSIALAERVGSFLAERFCIAVRLDPIAHGKCLRIQQVREPKNRPLVDIWSASVLPPTQRVREVLVVSPPELIANKVMAISRRHNNALAGTDWRDAATLLLQFPDLKKTDGPVRIRLGAALADSEAITTWEELVHTEIRPDRDEDEFWQMK